MKRIFPFFLLMAILRLSSAQVSIQDSLALVSLYHATDGPNWKNNANWLQGPVSTWHGVTLQGDRVYILNLFDNGLNGYIPSSIGQLTGVVELSLRKSTLTGTIPDEVGLLTEIYQLNFSECGLTGEIPQSLGNCLQLGRLYLSKNQLTGTIPSSLTSCTNMIILDVRENLLSGGFPEVIRSFTLLQQLDISSNAFSGPIPNWIAELDKLYGLYLNNIPFDGPMPFLGEKPNLTQFTFSDNTVTGNLEDILGYYPNLAYCTIERTRLSGRLSPDHFNPQTIIRLYVLHCGIHELGNFSDWINYPNFTQLIISNNHLDFDDLLQNSTMPSNRLLWYPQNPIGMDTTITLFPGEDFAFQSPMLDAGITYQWYKDNQLISGAQGPQYAFNPFTSNDTGEYFFVASHPAFAGFSILSAKATLLEETSGLSDPETEEFQLFPNPFAEQFTIEMDPLTAYRSFNLLNEGGQVLRTQAINGNTIQISATDLPPGIYFLQLNGPEKNSIKRIIKL